MTKIKISEFFTWTITIFYAIIIFITNLTLHITKKSKVFISALFKAIMKIEHSKSLRYSFNLEKILVLLLIFIKGLLGITFVILVFSIFFSRTAYTEGPALVTNLSKYYGILYKSTIPFWYPNNVPHFWAIIPINNPSMVYTEELLLNIFTSSKEERYPNNFLISPTDLRGIGKEQYLAPYKLNCNLFLDYYNKGLFCKTKYINNQEVLENFDKMFTYNDEVKRLAYNRAITLYD